MSSHICTHVLTDRGDVCSECGTPRQKSVSQVYAEYLEAKQKLENARSALDAASREYYLARDAYALRVGRL